MAEVRSSGKFERKLIYFTSRLQKAQQRRLKRDWPMTAGVSARQCRSDRLTHDTLALVHGTIDSNTQVSPAKKDIIWVVDEGTGCRYQHPKHYQHITDTALLQLVNDAIRPEEIGLDKLRKIKRAMKYVKRVGFRSCLCVVCLVLKLLLAATHTTLNRDNITKNVHCRVQHANCQCKRQVPRTANHATTNATTGSGGGCEHSESMLGGTAMTVEQTTASPPPIPVMNAGAREDCGATKSATAALPVLMPATTVTNGETFTAATPAVAAAPLPHPEMLVQATIQTMSQTQTATQNTTVSMTLSGRCS